MKHSTASVIWFHSKQTKTFGKVHHFSFQDFKPTYRGRDVENADPLAPAKIQQVGMLISDKKEGPFSIAIDWIKGYREAEIEDSNSQ